MSPHSLPPIIALCLWGMLGMGEAVWADQGNKGAWGDQGNGTFKNPILPGDYSDPDVIRVGSDYYLITSTFQYSPGMAVLHSKDLVNWEFISHCVSDLTQIGPELNWDRMARYNRGIYAGAIRYHDGKFWVYFTTMDEGVFMTTATNPAGPWSPVYCVWNDHGHDDPCPFWDEDGKAYLLLSKPGSQWWTHLYRMSPDGRTIDPASDLIVDNYKGSEGNKLYKFGKVYYVFHNQIDGPGNRTGVFMRSTSLNGPWEKKVVLHAAGEDHEREPNQGGLVDTPDGQWWFITQQGRGAYEGRSCCLLPVRWSEGWPIIGELDGSSDGNIVWTAKKPIPGFPVKLPQTSDEFEAPPLGPQWEWNYQPRADKWSLAERPGFLRLKAFKPLIPNNFNRKHRPNEGGAAPVEPIATTMLFGAGNTLTQRLACTEGGEVTILMDVSGMTSGETSGICHYGRNYCTFGVAQSGKKRSISYYDSATNTTTSGPELSTSKVWLRFLIDNQGVNRCAYSLDGKAFHAFGSSYSFEWANYRGDRIGIFNTNLESDSGLVDVDWFHYEYASPQPSPTP